MNSIFIELKFLLYIALNHVDAQKEPSKDKFKVCEGYFDLFKESLINN
jgi:hypothetical protein